MAINLKNAIIKWCVEHKIPSKINLGVLVIALVELLSLITIWCSLGIPDGCREVIRAAPIGKIGSILITLMYALRWFIEQGAKELCTEQQKIIDDLERTVNNLTPLKNNLEEIFDVWLLYALNRMQLGNGSRASFYVYDDRGGKNDQFCLVARESKDPRNKKKGRTNFPFTQGVINAAWMEDDGKRFLFVPPKVKTDTDYIVYMVSNGGLPKEVAENLTMKSKCILGGLIGDTVCKVGVIIIEGGEYINKSQDRERIIKNFRGLQTEFSPYLCKLFKVYSNQILTQEDPS